MPETYPPDSCKVYTPRTLAEAMVMTVGVQRNAQWLEPSVGRGVFLDVLRTNNVPPRDIVAIDLDPEPSPLDLSATTLRSTDFLLWAHRTDMRFDRIIGNPPYLKLGSLPSTVREAALKVPAPQGGFIA